MKKNVFVKLIMLVLVAVMCCSLFIGCSKKKDDTVVRVGALTGPTAIGILNLKADSEANLSTGKYEFTLEAEAQTINAQLIKGDLDIVLIPANVASKLYNNPNIAVSVIDINTKSVLYCLTGDTTVTSFDNLTGKTVLVPNQGTMPDAVVLYLKSKKNIDFTITYSTPAEIQQALIADPNKIGILPQPAATATVINSNNSASEIKVKTAFALEDTYNEVTTDGSSLITGVTIVRNDFLQNHKELVDQFLVEHAASAEKANTDVDKTADLVVASGILPKAPIAKQAIPKCGITCITKTEMKTKLSGLLTALHSVIPDLTGNVPSDNFYYLG
ncbi:MAG: ABC transporter substrate-binding protein [Clostridia bacterium]|nr:ABC transporter substrate-binding protein [Clostridia bacterium]